MNIIMKSMYNHLNEYYKSVFNERVLKISIDGGFSCPNRDGKCGVGGCIFCNETGSGKNRQNISIKDQILNHLNSYRGERANKFIVYFQNFSNTYDSIENLKNKYDEALSVSNKIVGISIATRPDCIDDKVARLISSYKDKYYVQVELGLQTSNEDTARIINRGYLNSIFTNAVEILNRYCIDVVVHIMVGLPNESNVDILNTIDFINRHSIKGVKIHSTYVVKNTKLCELFEKEEYHAISYDDYMNSLCLIISHLRPDIIIHRISGDAPKDQLVAPTWNTHKKLVLNGIDKLLKDNDLYQGKFYKIN